VTHFLNFLGQSILNRVGYDPEISHGVLVETDEHRKELEKKTKPILETLRSYQDLPPVSLFFSNKEP
jgi:HAUS augmin-like complex subunit 1